MIRWGGRWTSRGLAKAAEIAWQEARDGGARSKGMNPSGSFAVDEALEEVIPVQQSRSCQGFFEKRRGFTFGLFCSCGPEEVYQCYV